MTATLASADTIAKASRLRVERLEDGRFRTQSDSAEARIVRNTTAGLVCTCGSGSANTVCSHRIAVTMFVERENGAKTPTVPFNVDDFTGEELDAMTLFELGSARNMVTATIAEVGKAIRQALDTHAVNEIAMQRCKLVDDARGYAASREAYILSRTVLKALQNRLSVANKVMSSLQTAMRSAQVVGG